MRISILIILISALLAAAGCSRAPVITLVNQSSNTLSNVVVSGSGFSEHVANIPAGGSQRLRVRPQGESGLRMTFDAGTRHVDSGEQGYFEAGGGYRITATVATNLNVSISDELKEY